MPFTMAHPAFAFPLKYVNPRWFSVTGLVLGSMGPDFEYFLAMEPHQTIGHTFEGLFVQVIPLSVLFALLFHGIVKEALALHLPSAFRMNRKAYSLLCVQNKPTIRSALVFLVSVSIGFFTHVAIDAFTHEGGLVVVGFPALETVVFGSLPMYKALQYGLSLIGLTVAARAIGLALYRAEPDADGMSVASPGRKLRFWGIVAAAAVLTAAGKILTNSDGNLIGMLVVAPITGGCAGITLASIIWRLSRRTGSLRSPNSGSVE